MRKGFYDKYFGVSTFYKSKLKLLLNKDIIDITPSRADNFSILISQYLGDGSFDKNSSFLNNIPKSDLLTECYKRLYHNVTLLTKSKGTKQGLKHLMSVFGTNENNITIKEFGGINTLENLDGFNKSKIKIINNSITGSILSPLIRLDQYPTSSRDKTNIDLHFIDVSISPQDNINTQISSSISTTNPDWVIDDYIGYPEDEFNNEYKHLNQEKNFYNSITFGNTRGFDYM